MVLLIFQLLESRFGVLEVVESPYFHATSSYLAPKGT